MQTFGSPEQQPARNNRLGDDLRTSQNKREADLNTSSQGHKNQSNIHENIHSEISEPSIIKKVSASQANPNSQPQGIKSKSQFLNGYSFSRFQAISDQAENESGTATGRFMQSTGLAWKKSNKVPTSTKVISSKKIIDDPVQVKSFHQTQAMSRSNSEEKHGSTFQFCHLNQADLFQKFLKYSVQKGMDFKISENLITVIKKASIFKSVLSLCFPGASQFENQIYQLACVSENTAKLTQTSGSDSNYYEFREQFLVRLWAEKYLVSGSLHQNLRHFLRFANSLSEKNQSKSNLGQVDKLKLQIETTIKKISSKYQKESKQKQKQKSKSNVQIKTKQQYFQKFNTPELVQIKQKLKQMQQILKQLLQKQLRKQERLKKLRSGSGKRIQFEDKGQININQQQEMKSKVLITPSMERMLMNIFYLHLDLEQMVKAQVVSQKHLCDFEKKKMIIKGSLSATDIFRYLQLNDFNKILEKLPPQQQKQIFMQSIKILGSLRYATSPCPAQTMEIISILKTTLTKQIQHLNKLESSNHVKMQDHNNKERTLFQFCIYCLIMCDNRDIYPTVETALIFSDTTDLKAKLLTEESVKMAAIIKKSIDFIENQWQL